MSVRYYRLYWVHHKKHETPPTNPAIHIYINRINKILLPQIKDTYKIELQTSETIKLFDSTEKVNDKTKYGENVPILEVVEVVLGQCKLTDNHFQKLCHILLL